MNTPPIIGITGKAGAGKDTLAAHLTQQYGYTRVAFADPLRRGLSSMLNLGSEHYEHPLKEQMLEHIGKSPRELLQTLGTEWGRKLVNPELWMILAAESIRSGLQQGGRVVITDVRFENEAALVRSMSGVIWHVLRETAGTKHSHASEEGIAFDPYTDYPLRNDGSVSDLYAHVDMVLA